MSLIDTQLRREYVDYNHLVDDLDLHDEFKAVTSLEFEAHDAGQIEVDMPVLIEEILEEADDEYILVRTGSEPYLYEVIIPDLGTPPMEQIGSVSEYYEIVDALATEFIHEIEDGAGRSLANHVVASFEINNGKPVVHFSAEYEGGPVEAIDQALNPYDILAFSTVERLPESMSDTKLNYRDEAAGRACEALTLDLLDAVEAMEADQ